MTTKDDKGHVLITGSSGLIGSQLIKALEGDYHVTGIDLKEPDIDSEWIKCDMTDDKSVKAALDEFKSKCGDRIVSVIHLAAYYDFSGEPSPLYEKLTVDGTRRLMRALQGLHVEQFVFSSTLLVMQSSEDEVTASSPTEAEWDYPQSKLEAEKVIKEERGAIPAVALRMAGVYNEDCSSLPIAQQIARIYEKQLESYVFPGDKSHGQSFIHLDDLVACFEKVIERRKELPEEEVLLIGEEDVMSYEELQNELGKLIHGDEWPTIRIPKPVAKAGAWAKDKMAQDEEDAPFIKPWMIDLADQNYPVDIERARNDLHWSPQHTLRETLPEMIRRLKKDPKQWYEMNGLPLPDELKSQSPEEAGKR